MVVRCIWVESRVQYNYQNGLKLTIELARQQRIPTPLKNFAATQKLGWTMEPEGKRFYLRPHNDAAHTTTPTTLQQQMHNIQIQ